MARIRYSHNSFSIGVLSKKVQGNTEFEGYNNSLEECVNFQIQQTGGIFKRGGTKFMGETKNGPARLILFNYSAEDQYVCEFGEKYIRFFTKYGRVEDENENIIELKTPFTYEDVLKIKTFQDGNSLNLVTPLGLYSIERTKTDEFVFSQQLGYSTEPLTFTNRARIALKPSGVGGDITITAVDPSNPNKKPPVQYHPVFYASDAGHLLCIEYLIANTVSGYSERKKIYLVIKKVLKDTGGFNKVIASIDSSKSLVSELPNTEPSIKWQIGAFSEDRGMPKAATIYEGRLFFANNKSNPIGVWGSSLLYGDWSNFEMGTNDADAVQFKMQSNQADEILWLASQSKLYAGTRHGVYIGGSASFNDEAITPSNFRLRLFEAMGVSPLQPIEALDCVFFVDMSGRNVHEIRLSSETGNYEASDISLLANDLTTSGIVAHAWQQTPIKTYWCAVEDGFLCSLTYLKNNGILAWAKHEIAGKSVKVEDLCTIRGAKNDLLFMVVRREVNGEFKRFIEYLTPAYDPLNQEEFKQFYVDCGKKYENKYKILGIDRGKKCKIKIPFSKSIQNLIIKNSGKLTYMQRVSILPDGKKMYFTAINFKSPLDNSYIIFEIPPNKGDVAHIGIHPENNKGALWVSKIDKMLGRDIYCDTSCLNVGDVVITDDTVYNNPHTIVAKSSNYVTVDHRFNAGRSKNLYLIWENAKLEQSFKPATLQLEDSTDNPIPTDKFYNVYLNKINGTTQLNQKKFRAYFSPKKTVELHDAENHTVLEFEDASPFDTVDVSGNCYLYFNQILEMQHLAGQTVALCIDGNNGGEVLVPQDGIIKLPHEAMYVSAGLKMKAYFKTTPFSGGCVVGSSVGAVGGQKSMWAYVYYSLGGKYGADPKHLYNMPYTNFISSFNKTKNLITGLVKCPIVNSTDIYDRSIYMEHDEPLSFNVLSITQDIEVSDS